MQKTSADVFSGTLVLQKRRQMKLQFVFSKDEEFQIHVHSKGKAYLQNGNLNS